MNILEKVLTTPLKADSYTTTDVKNALLSERLTIDEFASLLSKAGGECLEELAKRAKYDTSRYFGNSVSLFTPLYISNFCDNDCVYCGFGCRNKIKRAKLALDEIEKELSAIAATGLREILLLTGESRSQSDVKYIAEAVKLASKYFSCVGIEIYPLTTDEYKIMHENGADFVSVYQETYNKKRYKQVHLTGPKSDYEYRFNAQERALQAGLRGVAFGSLLGLGNWYEDTFYAGVHAYYILKKYPHAEISFSFPRLRNTKTSGFAYTPVTERELLQIMLAYRFFMPFAGITISTREAPNFRDNVIGLVATKISAGVSVGVGGHSEKQKGDEQFQIADSRSVKEMHELISRKGLQAVYLDYI
jgi:2-iminoacetate synthase